jgi:PAS domain S-box-containing protein
MRILVAEDNAFSLSLLQKTLAHAGYEVVAADDGETAWKVVQQDNPPRLALIDWMMPGISGVELCRRIREIDSAFPIYIVLLTAKTNKESVLEGFAAGADDFIKKPFDHGELLARVQVGRRLVEQRAMLHCLIDSIPDPIYFKDSRGFYLGCNKAFGTFVGKEKDEIISNTAANVLNPELAQVSHMEDLKVLSSGEATESEGWVEAADGTPVYHSTVKVPYLESSAGSSGMIGVSRNITKRIRMEQELKRLAVVVEQSTESIMITDVSGAILYVNAAFESTTGYSSAEVVGLSPSILTSGKHDTAFFRKLWDAISAGKTWEGCITNVTKDGTLYHEEAVIYPIRDHAGKLMNYVAISRDITKELAIENQLRQQQKMNAIGELAGGVSHDFNNILTAILGYVALCMNVVDEESKVYGYLNEIVKAGDRAAKLVRQILTFSRQEEQEFHAVDLQSVIEDSVNMVRSTLEKKVVVELDIGSVCEPILGDTTQLQQVMINLCTNASHALKEEAGGVLRVVLKQVEVSEHNSDEKDMMDLEPGSYAYVTVEDTGCGMSSALMERIFEPYFTTKRKGEGTGFGLSIVHGIVQKHHGRISVESEVGKGTRFSLFFPVLQGDVEEKEEIRPSVSSKRGRVLFVDDDSAVLSMGKKILESFGCHVATATNGRGALEILRQQADAFDTLITDYSMPEMNGHELISACLELRPDLQCILCSGYMEKVEGEGLKKLRNTLFMTKPIDWKKLGNLILEQVDQPV